MNHEERKKIATEAFNDICRAMNSVNDKYFKYRLYFQYAPWIEVEGERFDSDELQDDPDEG